MPPKRPRRARSSSPFCALALAAVLVAVLAPGCARPEAPPGHPHDATAAVDPGPPLDEARQLYTCGMHPQVVQEGPGQCPLCGMDLTPLNETTTREGVVEIDPATMQNIGVRTAVVAVEPLGRSVRTTGRFEASEQGRTAVSPRVGGWVEQLFVDYEGARVRKGQPLLALYSPDLVSTQEEYLLARRHAERMGHTAEAERLVEAARRRLAYWDVTDAQIRQLEATGAPQKTLTLYAPASGTVTKKEVVAGQQVAPGMTLLELTDLSRLWLMVDVYEQDLSWVKVGTPVQAELPYAPGRTLTGRVDFVYDTLDPETRTLKARVPLSNPGLSLKPGMYATVTLTGGEAVARPVVPEEALLRTGDRAVVILAVGDGRFRPHEVVPGLQTAGRVEILEGLTGGEEVVTSAQFLIDSEARLKSAVGAMMTGHTHGEGEAAAPPPDVRAVPADVHAADANGDGRVFQCVRTPHLLRDGPGALPGCTGRVQEVPLGVAQSLLHETGYTNVPIDPAPADRDGDGYVYQSPMHWANLKDAPGRCDICGMSLEKVTLDQARQNLRRQGYRVR